MTSGQEQSTKINIIWAVLISFALYGTALRLLQFFSLRSMWHDECSLALAILNAPYAELMGTLQFRQAAPLGFLWLIKCLVQTFGVNDFVFRMLPLVFGILSCWLILPVATKILKRSEAFFAVALFVMCDRLIYYAGEFKQYSGDVCIGLFVLFVAFQLLDNAKSKLWFRVLLITGVLAPWFSQPSVFLLAGYGFVFAFVLWRRGEVKTLLSYWPACVLWLMSFLILYQISIGPMLHAVNKDWFWASRFVPPPHLWWQERAFLGQLYLGLFHDPASFVVPWLAGLLFFLGLMKALWQKNASALMLFAPLPLIVIAAMLHRYSVVARLMLFTTPILIIFVASGLECFRFKFLKRWGVVPVLCLGLVLVMPAFAKTINGIQEPRKHEEIKPALKFIEENWKEGDVLYVYYGANKALKYYALSMDFYKDLPKVVGEEYRESPMNYDKDIALLGKAPRVWFLFSHIWTFSGTHEEKVFLQLLERRKAKLLLVKQFHGSSTYLANLS